MQAPCSHWRRSWRIARTPDPARDARRRPLCNVLRVAKRTLRVRTPTAAAPSGCVSYPTSPCPAPVDLTVRDTIARGTSDLAASGLRYRPKRRVRWGYYGRGPSDSLARAGQATSADDLARGRDSHRPHYRIAGENIEGGARATSADFLRSDERCCRKRAKGESRDVHTPSCSEEASLACSPHTF